MCVREKVCVRRDSTPEYLVVTFQAVVDSRDCIRHQHASSRRSNTVRRTSTGAHHQNEIEVEGKW